jgi:hypothetical protein
MFNVASLEVKSPEEMIGINKMITGAVSYYEGWMDTPLRKCIGMGHTCSRYT